MSPGREAALRRRRRPGLWGAGLALIAVGGLGAAALVGQAGDRVEVLAVNRPVAAGQPIGEQDLTVARIPADPGLRPVRAADLTDVVGRVAAVELHPGDLLTAAELTDTAVPGPGEQVVGIAVRRGQLPARGLHPGDAVLLIPTPGELVAPAGDTTGGTAGVVLGEPIPARVTLAGPADLDGVSTVDLVVAATVGPQAAELASTGRVALVLLPVGGE